MKKTLNILEVSNEFRQKGAQREAFEAEIVTLGLHFAARATYLRGELHKNDSENRAVLNELKNFAEKIVKKALMKQYDKIVLPHEGVSIHGGWIKNDVCKPLSSQFNVSLVCQGRRFFPNYTNVDAGIGTCLDEGIRGVANVAPPWEQKRKFVA